MPIPKVKIPADKVVHVKQSHSANQNKKQSAKIGKCLACGASGRLVKPHGHPAYSKTGIASELTHKEDCPMNEILDTEGDIIEF